jgi:RimJ/RimL family protein N-acetyltransferase
MIFDFKTDYILEDERVILSPLESKHFEELLHFSENEPEIWDYSVLHSDAAGKENLKKYIDFALSCREKGSEYGFIVFDKLKNAFAGSTRFYNIDLEEKTLEIGYTWYGKEFQGTRLNKHCKFLLLEFSFEKIGIERVGFSADSDNSKSIAAMKSIGCTIEGTLRSTMFKKNGKRRNSTILSILKKEWDENVKQNLKNKL